MPDPRSPQRHPAPLSVRCNVKTVRPLLRAVAVLAGEKQGDVLTRLLTAELDRLGKGSRAKALRKTA